jgi:hypothetical protein
MAVAVNAAILGAGALNESALLRRGRRPGGDKIKMGQGDHSLFFDFGRMFELDPKNWTVQ